MPETPKSPATVHIESARKITRTYSDILGSDTCALETQIVAQLDKRFSDGYSAGMDAGRVAGIEESAKYLEAAAAHIVGRDAATESAWKACAIAIRTLYSKH